jgi:hypothetical protein
VNREFPLESSHGVTLGLLVRACLYNLEWVYHCTSENIQTNSIELTRANETISRNILSRNYGFEQEAILRVFCYAEVGHAWCHKVCRQFNIYWHAVPSSLL